MEVIKNKFNKLKYSAYTWTCSIFTFFLLNSTTVVFASKQDDAVQEIWADVSGALNALIIFSILTSVLLGIIHGVRMAKYGATPTKQKESTQGLLVVFIVSACLGGFSLIGQFIIQLLFFR